VKQPRRLGEGNAGDAFRALQRGALRHATIAEEAFRALEAERPGLIVSDEGALLVGVPHGAALDLQYAFRDRDAFAQRFPEMLLRIARAAKQSEAPLGLRFRLTARSDRAYVEPVLRASAFELSREWWRMVLHELPSDAAPRDALAPGFAVRGARLEDAEAIAELDAIAFEASFLTSSVVRDGMLEERHVVRLLEETSTERAAGFLRLRSEGTATGYVSDIAVHPDYQRRGLGEALMRWALGWFREQGLRRAALTVNTGNAPAIALYRKLGFTPDEMGLDYRRPIDEEEVRQVLERQQTVRIKVGPRRRR
jgi:ribosomal protein S18 acetylase RimI-like enzyme